MKMAENVSYTNVNALKIIVMSHFFYNISFDTAVIRGKRGTLKLLRGKCN
jgi:hypothetical protein